MQQKKSRSRGARSSTAARSSAVGARSSDISLDDLQPPQSIRLEALIGYLLRCAENVVTASYYTTAGSEQINHRQLAILISLHQHGHATQTELAMRLRIDRSTINEMIPRMVERGLIARDESFRDRRAFEVRLTDVGRAALLKIYPDAYAAHEKCLACLPKEYRKIFLHCLEQILDNNEEVFLAKSVGSGRTE